MKRIVTVCLILGLLVGAMAMPAEAGKKGKRKNKKIERKVQGTYICPCGFQVAGRGPGFILSSGEGGFSLPITNKETFVSLELTDDSGQPVFFSISQDTDGDQISETDVGEGCGKTEEPLPIANPGLELNVFLFSGTCDTGAAVATGGSYTAVLSNRP